MSLIAKWSCAEVDIEEGEEEAKEGKIARVFAFEAISLIQCKN